MRKISISSLSKTYRTICGQEIEYIQSKENNRVIFNTSHTALDDVKRNINGYMYYIRFTGTIWRKTKRKDHYEYYDEDAMKWVLDKDMDNDYLAYMDWGEGMTRLVP